MLISMIKGSNGMKTITKKLIKLPKRKVDSKKGDNGRVLIVGGSPEFIGAPALAGIAAMRAGADSVVVASPKKVAWTINELSADLVTKKLSGEYLSLANFKELRTGLRIVDCLLIGGGISERTSSMRLIRKIIENFSGLKVLDAAALFAFNEKSLRNSILLPNQKEFGRLKRRVSIIDLMKRKNIVVAKSYRTKIISGSGMFENRTGNAGLTRAGTGDVLAGLTAGFLAQSRELLQTAINSVYFLGKLGDILQREKKGYFYLASELAQDLERIFGREKTGR